MSEPHVGTPDERVHQSRREFFEERRQCLRSASEKRVSQQQNHSGERTRRDRTERTRERTNRYRLTWAAGERRVLEAGDAAEDTQQDRDSGEGRPPDQPAR